MYQGPSSSARRPRPVPAPARRASATSARGPTRRTTRGRRNSRLLSAFLSTTMMTGHVVPVSRVARERRPDSERLAYRRVKGVHDDEGDDRGHGFGPGGGVRVPVGQGRCRGGADLEDVQRLAVAGARRRGVRGDPERRPGPRGARREGILRRVRCHELSVHGRRAGNQGASPVVQRRLRHGRAPEEDSGRPERHRGDPEADCPESRQRGRYVRERVLR